MNHTECFITVHNRCTNSTGFTIVKPEVANDKKGLRSNFVQCFEIENENGNFRRKRTRRVGTEDLFRGSVTLAHSTPGVLYDYVVFVTYSTVPVSFRFVEMSELKVNGTNFEVRALEN